MRQLVRHIVDLGVKEHHTVAEQKHIRLLNRLCLGLMSMSVVFMSGSFIMNNHRWTLATILLGVLTSTTMFLNANEKNQWAKRFLLYGAYVVIATLIVLYGRNSNGEFLLLVLPALGALFYQQKRNITLLLVLSVGGLIFTYYFYLNSTPYFHLYQIVEGNAITAFFTLFVLFFAIYFFKSETSRAEETILDINTQLLKEVEERKLAIQSMEEARGALAESEGRYRMILDNAFDGIFLIDTQKLRPISANRRVLAMYKCTEEEFLTANFDRFMPMYQPDGTYSAKGLFEHLTTAMMKGSHEFEWMSQGYDGTLIPTASTLASLPGPNKHLVAAFVKDISKQKEAEIKQEEAMERLEKVNKELAQFAYVTSHDLKAPLRAIGSLAEWLYKDYKDQIDEEGKEMLNLLMGRTQRMQNLIEGILMYSRVGRGEEKKTWLSVQKVVEEIIQNFDLPDHIDVQIKSCLPDMYFTEIRLIQLFQNLIGNAIKFMDKDQGCIKIGFEERKREWAFFVEDNGPGIEEIYFDKIFKVFQTLHTRDEKESTGVGLSIVKKVVEQYKGRIELQSELGKGSTFWLIFPRLIVNPANIEKQDKLLFTKYK